MRLQTLVVGLLGCSCSAPKSTNNSNDFLDTGNASFSNPLEWSVKEEGPYRVGYSTMETTYSPGADFADRTIRLHIWYPTEDESGISAEYTVGIDSLVFKDAQPAPPDFDSGYPVHVHSHGFRAYGATSVFMARYLATHGWLTVAPDHTENTILDHTDPLPTAHYFHRPLDVQQSLDAVANLPSEHPLRDHADTHRVVLSGHSFGAYTVWSAIGASYDPTRVADMCETGDGLYDDGCTPEEQRMFGDNLSDSRIVAAIPMAGTLRRSWFGDTGEMDIHGPVLYFGGTEDERGQQEQFDDMGSIDFTWMELAGGCHQTFALGTCSTLDPNQGFAIVQTASLAFARVHILGDTGVETVAIATGEDGLSDVVTTRRR